MRFNRLRLTGFKSFLEPTELLLDSGKTGIVGPNGCGKSNLVEAMRWVMGENSAKRMRGGEMDDVIFGGTGNRPARNIAEVSILIDNRDRRAPAAFNDVDDIEVSRRIERGSGSVYRVNGRDVRARDVQLLFADAATGPQSNSMVSQGKVGALINAKPAARRAILEDAAGIAGLHARRNEAEGRLRAADNNLTRLEDVIGALEGQLESLKKQAKQASRYRSISQRLRKAEAVVLYLRHLAATARCRTAGQAFEVAEREVAEKSRHAAETLRQSTEAAEVVPQLREAEAEAAAALRRHLLARDELDKEEERVTVASKEAAERLAQVVRDLERETTLGRDADAALARLAGEVESLRSAQQAETELLNGTESALKDAGTEEKEADARLTEATRALASAIAQRQQAERRAADADQLLTKRRQAREVAAGRHAAIVQEAEGLTDPAPLAERVNALEEDLESVRSQAEAAGTAAEEAEAAAASAKRAAGEAESALRRLDAEINGLEAALRKGGAGQLPSPLIEALQVPPGLEAAVAAALGADITASLEGDAGRRWEERSGPFDLAPLPEGARALPVVGPPALARRLAAIGLVEDDETARRLAPTLAAGQRLVTPEGKLWRWDGLVAEERETAAAEAVLEQRNHLAALAEERQSAAKDVEAAGGEADRLAVMAEEMRQKHREARRERDRLADELEKARKGLFSAREARDRLTGRLERAAAEQSAAAAAEAEAEEAYKAARSALEATEPSGALRAAEEEAQAAQAAARARVAEKRAEHDRLLRDARHRGERLVAIDIERRSWQGRKDGASGRLAELELRRSEIETQQAELARRPAEIAEARSQVLDLISAGEIARNQAADALATSETALREAEQAQRKAEAELAAAREARVRAEAQRDQANDALQAEGRPHCRAARMPPRRFAVAGRAPGCHRSEPAPGIGGRGEGPATAQPRTRVPRGGQSPGGRGSQ